MNKSVISISVTTLFAASTLVALAAPPNIVLLIADDLGYADLSCTETAKDVHTPHIDQLAAEGVRFTQAYATAPICNASRIAIATGRYQQRQGVHWYSGRGLRDAAVPTIAEVLKARGYATGYVGKVHHGSDDTLHKRGFPLNHGYDEFFGCVGGTKHYLHHDASYGKTKLHEGPLWDQRETKSVTGFTTSLYGERSRAFIRDHKDGPFFLTVSFNAVHNFTHQLPKEYLEQHQLKGFPDLQPGEDYWAWRKKISFPAHPEGRAYYLGQLHYLDLEVGRIVKQLEQSGVADHTAIFFVGDNGGSLVTYADNTPLKGGKYTLYEGGIRVPFIARFPARFPGSKVSHATASTLDLLPTIGALADVSTLPRSDGLNLSGAWSDPSRSTPRTLFWDTKSEQAVREGKWKLLVTRKSPNPRLQIQDTPKGTFLFDLSTDPGETTNLVKKHPEIVRRLTTNLQTWQAELK